MKMFREGQTVASRSICDSDCIFRGEILKRTEKTVTVKTVQGVKRCKIHIYDEEEFIYPFGQYSMAAIFKASRETV